ncbi:fumarylacetoacetate hydrolase-like protein [Aaosphaeria arxii CBS 175.79]|uniref:Fumarylacetoacetate hydrolase-like protein n=1 Tax=Aaosphaeria arxii CBS 175.79 TaxID=1450172 RepID=A0A6A5XLA8_9PLEO|nr:fumarylacetoacetate hydrolase-like protein [Aaosphaeria arxii CBS 175.79]KAF2013597.1 fumarylacetoacetate hydrolase-like protein [Aaosphaeria arxii CBS 175.79]
MSYTNYVAYQDPRTYQERIGHFDLSNQTIRPLSFKSGTSVENLYQVIEVGEDNIISAGEPLAASTTKILPPLTGRDVLCVGKNYAEHAKEFNSSGFDSSDKVDQPSHPVIFTKRFTSIIADGEEIYPHPEFTQTADYEGEIGVIIGKPGFRISEAEALDHVWGYTIINDMTARERQRDHKQFYIGKSPDTFCPMGPIAVPASKLDKVLRVQTYVNGELRQNATTDDLIFSIPYLIKTMSEGQTLVPGDVLATGTPAGVGIGRTPPVYLKPGDTIAVSINGLGTLTNRIADVGSANPTRSQVERRTHLTSTNATKTAGSSVLTQINKKPLYYKSLGSSDKPPIVFVHGLGGSHEYFAPLIQSTGIERRHSLHLLDLEGHGLSPTSPLSKLSIESFAEDLDGVFQHADIRSGATIVGHSLGCLIAVQFALRHPEKVSKLVLFGPPPSPLPEASVQAFHDFAATVRTQGIPSIADTIVSLAISAKTTASNPIVASALRMALLGQDPEGYAKACTALAESETLDFAALHTKTLIVTGSDDQISPPDLCKRYVVGSLGGNAGLEVLEGVGHWHVFEDLQGVVNAITGFL